MDLKNFGTELKIKFLRDRYDLNSYNSEFNILGEDLKSVWLFKRSGNYQIEIEFEKNLDFPISKLLFFDENYKQLFVLGFFLQKVECHTPYLMIGIGQIPLAVIQQTKFIVAGKKIYGNNE